MITGGKKWHYLTVKSLSALLKRISSNHVRDFYCLHCFHSHRTKNKLKKHERVCNDHDYCYVETPDEGNKILKYNYVGNSLKAPFIIYADLECLLEKMLSCQNNLEKSYTEKKTKHTSSGYSLSTNCSFDSTKNKLDCYRGKDCLEKFCKDLRQHAMKTINLKEKEMIPLTSEENEYYEMEKLCQICKNNLVLIKIIKKHSNYTIKLEIIVITLEKLEELLKVFVI